MTHGHRLRNSVDGVIRRLTDCAACRQRLRWPVIAPRHAFSLPFARTLPHSTCGRVLGVDVPSYAQAALSIKYFTTRPNHPPELLQDVTHTHRPTNDASGHVALCFDARRHTRTQAASQEKPSSGATQVPGRLTLRHGAAAHRQQTTCEDDGERRPCGP